MTVDVTSYQDAFANFDKGLAILNLIKLLLLEMSTTKPRNIFYFKENNTLSLDIFQYSEKSSFSILN